MFVINQVLSSPLRRFFYTFLGVSCGFKNVNRKVNTFRYFAFVLTQKCVILPLDIVLVMNTKQDEASSLMSPTKVKM